MSAGKISNFLLSENVLKQIKFEERHINRFFSDIIRDIEAVKLVTIFKI